MLLGHELRVQLRERRNRLYKTSYHDFANERRFFAQWMEAQPYTRAILAEIETADIDYETWKEDGGLAFRGLRLPETEHKRAKICIALLRSDEDAGNFRLGSSTRFDDINRDFVEAIVDPLVAFAEDRIDEGSAVLGLLLRYKRRVEWFERARLFALAKTDTARGEDELDADLRRFLLDHGIDFPFSQPESPTGKVDVIAGLDTPDPLALEIKLFDPEEGKDKAYVRKGFSQAYSYASDYGLPVGYLVVFNLTPEPLVFDVPNTRAGISSLRVGDRTIFLIAIETNPDVVVASRRKKVERHVIDAAYLLEGVKDDTGLIATD